MNIFIREMRAHRKSIIIWCIGILFMVVAGMAKFGAFESSGQSMNEIMGDMPKILQVIFGTGDLNLSTASGYYGILYLYIMLMTTIQAAMLGANIISKEERDKTSEFLFVKPASRKSIITAKLLASLTIILILNAVTLVSSILIVNKYSKGENINGNIIILMLGLLIMQLIFLSIGVAIAAVSKRPNGAAPVATGILLGTYMISVIIDFNEKLDVLKYLTPFKYYEAKNLMYGGGINPVFALLSAIIVIGLIYATYTFYTKRDLNV